MKIAKNPAKPHRKAKKKKLTLLLSQNRNVRNEQIVNGMKGILQCEC